MNRTTPVRLLSSRFDPKNAFVKALAERALEDAQEDKSLRVIPFEETFQWILKPDGVAFTAWLCLRKRCRVAASPKNMLRHFMEHPKEGDDFLRVRQSCSGLDKMAEFDFPKPVIHPRTGKPVEQIQSKFFQWHKYFRELAEAVHWPAREVGRMTWYQFMKYHSEHQKTVPGALGGKNTKAIDIATARKLQGMNRSERRKFFAQQELEKVRKEGLTQIDPFEYLGRQNA